MTTPDELLKMAEMLDADHKTLMNMINCTSPQMRSTSSEAASLLRRLAGEMEWRDMKTAPENKTILAIVDGQVRLVRWCKTSHVPIYGWNLADQGPEDFELCKPTKWMPLPKGES